MVLVDTPIWSLVLRRRNVDLSPHEQRLTQVLQQLVSEGQVQLMGATRQEVLSGIKEETQFRRICDHLRDFPNVVTTERDYEEAAWLSNQCRRSGIASTPVDMLICAVSLKRDWQVFTTDLAFPQYQRVVPIRLLSLGH